MELQLSPKAHLDAELRHRYHELCRRYGANGVHPPGRYLVDAFAEVAEAARPHGVGAVRAAVRYAGDAYEHIVGRWADPAWRAMVAIALDKGLGVGVPDAADRSEAAPAVRHRSAGFYSRELTITGTD